jgi:hypothetical protein
MSKGRSVSRRGWCLLVTLVAIVGLAGCAGDKRKTVRGTVTLKGQPLTSGTVRMFGPGDQLSTAEIRPDGTFAVTDVPAGEIRVAVVETAGGGAASGTGPGAPAGKRVRIPDKYKDVKTSGLVYSVDAGTETLAVQLN